MWRGFGLSSIWELGGGVWEASIDNCVMFYATLLDFSAVMNVFFVGVAMIAADNAFYGETILRGAVLCDRAKRAGASSIFLVGQLSDEVTGAFPPKLHDAISASMRTLASRSCECTSRFCATGRARRLSASAGLISLLNSCRNKC